MQKLVKALNTDEVNTELMDQKFFGSLRFLESPGVPPTKFVRFYSKLEPDVLFDIMCGAHTNYSADQRMKKAFSWKLTPPSAMISFAASYDPGGADERLDESKTLILRRSIAEAVDRTNAWMITDGNRMSMSTRLAGQAVLYARNNFEASEPPMCVGVTAFKKISFDKSAVFAFSNKDYNGRVQQYNSSPAVGDDALSPLDPYHTHYLMVEDEAHVDTLRGRFERYISSNDVSGDGIQTPKVGAHPATPQCPNLTGRARAGSQLTHIACSPRVLCAF